MNDDSENSFNPKLSLAPLDEDLKADRLKEASASELKATCPKCGYKAKDSDDPLLTKHNGVGECPRCGIIPNQYLESYSQKNRLTRNCKASTSPSTSEKSQDNSFFWLEKNLLKTGAIGGLVMMVVAVVWFILGYKKGLIFIYPPVLFMIGLFVLLKNLCDKPFKYFLTFLGVVILYYLIIGIPGFKNFSELMLGEPLRIGKIQDPEALERSGNLRDSLLGDPLILNSKQIEAMQDKKPGKSMQEFREKLRKNNAEELPTRENKSSK